MFSYHKETYSHQEEQLNAKYKVEWEHRGRSANSSWVGGQDNFTENLVEPGLDLWIRLS